MVRAGTSLDFAASISNVHKSFESEAYRVETKINERRAVKSAFIRFPGLPYELGHSPHRTEALGFS